MFNLDLSKLGFLNSNNCSSRVLIRGKNQTLAKQSPPPSPPPPPRTRCAYYRQPPQVCYRIKNVLIQWDPPKVDIIQRFHFLGIEKADPVLYESIYGPTLVHASQLPQEALRFPTPPGEVLACNSDSNMPPYLIRTYNYQGYYNFCSNSF